MATEKENLVCFDSTKMSQICSFSTKASMRPRMVSPFSWAVICFGNCNRRHSGFPERCDTIGQLGVTSTSASLRLRGTPDSRENKLSRPLALILTLNTCPSLGLITKIAIFEKSPRSLWDGNTKFKKPYQRQSVSDTVQS